jgi:hypothetical protein
LPELQSRPEESASSRQPSLQSTLFQPEHLEAFRLPPFGLVFFNHLKGEFDSLKGRANSNPEAIDQAGRLQEISRQHKTTDMGRPCRYGMLNSAAEDETRTSRAILGNSDKVS